MDNDPSQPTTDFARHLDHGEVWRESTEHLAPGPLSTFDRKFLLGVFTFAATLVVGVIAIVR